MNLNEINKKCDQSVKSRFCGYCNKNFNLNLEEFMKHTFHCEVDKCNKHYGDLAGPTA
jgi:hypothetical protein